MQDFFTLFIIITKYIILNTTRTVIKPDTRLPRADPGGGHGGQKTPPSGIILGKPNEALVV